MCENGEGIEADNNEAFKWYMKAAEHGIAAAQWKVGCAYDTGIGVDRNIFKARRWYEAALKNGYEGAKEGLVGLRNNSIEFIRRLASLRQQTCAKRV
jgi:TPR repeat protein